jgi:hypothetical protein
MRGAACTGLGVGWARVTAVRGDNVPGVSMGGGRARVLCPAYVTVHVSFAAGRAVEEAIVMQEHVVSSYRSSDMLLNMTNKQQCWCVTSFPLLHNR